MNIRLKALGLGGFLALTTFVAQPVKADDWNKRTEFQFNEPVEIPGRVLMAGKYVFELADNDSDRNVVQVYSEDPEGNLSLVTNLLAIPDYLQQTPDKPVVQFEERAPGAPEAIHSWFYPGENEGWGFVYHKAQNLQTAASVTPASTPAPAPVAAAAKPTLAATPQAKEEEPDTDAVAVEEELSIVQDAPAPQPAAESDTQDSAGPTLPETAGYSYLELAIGLAMLAAGAATVLTARRKSLA
jgi:hypothetical protein